MPGAPEQKAATQRSHRQLRRLETLVDVVYAIVLWRCFMLLPRPGGEQWNWQSLPSFLAGNLETLVLVALGVAVTIVYWLQSNTLFGLLERTDNKHTALAICQAFCLLLFLYAIRMGVVHEGLTGTKLLESTCALLLGVFSLASWRYAVNHHLLIKNALDPAGDMQISNRLLAEPLTACLTIPLALAGPIFWELGWLSYPLFLRLLKRRKRFV